MSAFRREYNQSEFRIRGQGKSYCRIRCVTLLKRPDSEKRTLVNASYFACDLLAPGIDVLLTVLDFV